MAISKLRETQAKLGSWTICERMLFMLRHGDLICKNSIQNERKENIRELTRGKLFRNKPPGILNMEIGLLQIVLSGWLFFLCCSIPRARRWVGNL